MVKFEDLSKKDQEKLLEQARKMVDEENIMKNAKAMYAIKKKNLTEANLEELYIAFNIKNNYSEEIIIKQRYTAMSNYLYKANAGKYTKRDATCVISTANEWEAYQQIANAVKGLMIDCYKLKL